MKSLRVKIYSVQQLSGLGPKSVPRIEGVYGITKYPGAHTHGSPAHPQFYELSSISSYLMGKYMASRGCISQQGLSSTGNTCVGLNDFPYLLHRIFKERNLTLWREGEGSEQKEVTLIGSKIREVDLLSNKIMVRIKAVSNLKGGLGWDWIETMKGNKSSN